MAETKSTKERLNTAVKVSAKDLTSGEYIEEGKKKLVKLKEKGTVSKVRILGTIVDKYVADDKNYGHLVLGDSTDTIRLKFFSENISTLENFEEGDLVDVIGFVDSYQDEVYVNPDIINKLEDPNWELLRNLELSELEEGEGEEEEDISDIVLEKIRELDSGEGASFNELLEELNTYGNNKVVDTVRELMFKGEVFEPKKERLKIVE